MEQQILEQLKEYQYVTRVKELAENYPQLTERYVRKICDRLVTKGLVKKYFKGKGAFYQFIKLE